MEKTELQRSNATLSLIRHRTRGTKDPYFALIHEIDFCDNLLTEFGMEPKVQDIRVFQADRSTGETERGERIGYQIELLQRLIQAYQTNRLHERIG